MADLPHAFFLPTRNGSLFCLYHAPQGPVQRGQVLHLHPFAEELNTCRRISAQFARALSAAGYAVLQFDMHGCGDSEGDFGDATWAIWLNKPSMVPGKLAPVTRVTRLARNSHSGRASPGGSTAWLNRCTQPLILVNEPRFSA